MSDFSTKFTTAAYPLLVGRLGDTTTLTADSGSPAITAPAIFDPLDDATETKRGVFTYQASDLGASVPDRGWTITYFADVWEVLEVRPDNAGGFECVAILPRLNT